MDLGVEEILASVSKRVKALERGSYWEFRVGETSNRRLKFANGSAREAGFESARAVSARVLLKGCWGFSAATLNRNDWKGAAERAAREALRNAVLLGKRSKNNGEEKVEDRSFASGRFSVKPKVSPEDVENEDILRRMKELHSETVEKFGKQKTDDDNTGSGEKSRGKLSGVSMGYSSVHKRIGLLNSSGSEAVQDLLYTYANATLTGKRNSRVEEHSGILGFQAGFEVFDGGRISSVYSGRRRWRVESDGMAGLLERLSFRLKEALIAKPARGGVFPVVVDEELVDVLIHEAFGHAAEADGVLNGESCLQGMIGRKLSKRESGENNGTDELNIVDDATMAGLWGSFFFDDEGVPSQKTEIVKRGILKSFMHSRETAAVMETVSTGNARSEGVGNIPAVRMSNTNLLPGSSSDEELIEDVKKGFLLGGSAGGQVDIASGNFQFNASYGYIIEKGAVKTPVKGVSLSGNTLEMLSSIEKIGRTPAVGMAGLCGKFGQSVPVVGFNPKVLLGRTLVGGA
ncbi:TldD/PmbA family protein [Candidatus Woesearchaeota archaeon]|nr:MAG: TldD/PmbA family protein [Candidatus Woesearchaeota archaeon]